MKLKLYIKKPIIGGGEVWWNQQQFNLKPTTVLSNPSSDLNCLCCVYLLFLNFKTVFKLPSINPLKLYTIQLFSHAIMPEKEQYIFLKYIKS